MTNVTKLSRVIKAIQGLLFISLGIVICVFYNNSSLHSAISYCVSTVILAYGLLTIAYSYLFQRGIASTDAISGVVLCSLSIFIYAVPDIVIKFYIDGHIYDYEGKIDKINKKEKFLIIHDYILSFSNIIDINDIANCFDDIC